MTSFFAKWDMQINTTHKKQSLSFGKAL